MTGSMDTATISVTTIITILNMDTEDNPWTRNGKCASMSMALNCLPLVTFPSLFMVQVTYPAAITIGTTLYIHSKVLYTTDHVYYHVHGDGTTWRVDDLIVVNIKKWEFWTEFSIFWIFKCLNCLNRKFDTFQKMEKMEGIEKEVNFKLLPSRKELKQFKFQLIFNGKHFLFTRNLFLFSCDNLLIVSLSNWWLHDMSCHGNGT